jgi:hypothetical protein
VRFQPEHVEGWVDLGAAREQQLVHPEPPVAIEHEHLAVKDRVADSQREGKRGA